MAASFRGLERWRESGRLASVRSVQRVPSVSLRQVGVRACRALADGRLLSVNSLGVIEQFDYAWRDWQLPAAAAADAAADSSAVSTVAATGAETAAEREEEEKEEEEEVGGDSEGEPGVEFKRYVPFCGVYPFVRVPFLVCTVFGSVFDGSISRCGKVECVGALTSCLLESLSWSFDRDACKHCRLWLCHVPGRTVPTLPCRYNLDVSLLSTEALHPPHVAHSTGSYFLTYPPLEPF